MGAQTLLNMKKVSLERPGVIHPSNKQTNKQTAHEHHERLPVHPQSWLRSARGEVEGLGMGSTLNPSWHP